MRPDVEIAEEAELWPIAQVAEEKLGIAAEHLVPYGHTKTKIDLGYLESLERRPDAKLVLVTAVSPTPAGEGKTTTAVGLTDGLRRLGHNAIVALREPSMGPVFGIKGGAAGGGYAQVVPMTDINLHFTGDLAAIAAANNLLAALIDNHIHQGNALSIDARTVTWKRAVDLNDRALRQITVGLGGKVNGFPREDGFQIVAASELMAIFSLATSLADLRERIGRIVVAHSTKNKPVTAGDLGADAAMTVLLRDALAPNLVQTLEHTPALIHGGPFANIAHGCNSVLATTAGLKLADIVITEAGFGSDLGAEKFFDLKCRAANLQPSATVVVATVRSMKHHGGVSRDDLTTPDTEAMRRGADNLRRHLRNLQDVFGVPTVVAINRFPSDSDEEIALLQQIAREEGVPAVPATHVVDGGAGAEALAETVVETITGDVPELRYAYPLDVDVEQKATLLAQKVYGATNVEFSTKAKKQLKQIVADGFGHLPICVAKTQSSFTTDPSVLGAPEGHTIDVREVSLSAGAGFIVLLTGTVMTMPGLPKHPATEQIEITPEGRISGLS